jgi:hypothetical protein
MAPSLELPGFGLDPDPFPDPHSLEMLDPDPDSMNFLFWQTGAF